MTNKNPSKIMTGINAPVALIASGMFMAFAAISTPQPANAIGLSDVFGVVDDAVIGIEKQIGKAGNAVGKKLRGVGRGKITPTGPSSQKQRPRSTTKRRHGSSSGHPGTLRESRGLPPARGNSSSSALPPSRGNGNSAGLPPARGASKPTGDRGLPPPRKRPRPTTGNNGNGPVLDCNWKFEKCSWDNDKHQGHGKKKRKNKAGKRMKHRKMNKRTSRKLKQHRGNRKHNNRNKRRSRRG